MYALCPENVVSSPVTCVPSAPSLVSNHTRAPQFLDTSRSLLLFSSAFSFCPLRHCKVFVPSFTSAPCLLSSEFAARTTGPFFFSVSFLFLFLFVFYRKWLSSGLKQAITFESGLWMNVLLRDRRVTAPFIKAFHETILITGPPRATRFPLPCAWRFTNNTRSLELESEGRSAFSRESHVEIFATATHRTTSPTPCNSKLRFSPGLRRLRPKLHYFATRYFASVQLPTTQLSLRSLSAANCELVCSNTRSPTIARAHYLSH